MKLNDVADEVRAQPGRLESFAKANLPRMPRGSIFVGAGDSYAAALAGFYLSRGSCLALDPYSLAAFPEMAAGKDVVFVSASGKTSSNLAAARRIRGVAGQTWAITTDVQGKLARMVDRTVRIPMDYVPKASGMLSFTLSLLAVLKMSSGEGPCDFRRAFRRGSAGSRAVVFGKGTTYFLGNNAAYAISVYAAGKTYELLGAKCHAELLEEFSHMEVFSLKGSDAVNAFGCFDQARMGDKLLRLLKTQGYSARLIPGEKEGAVEDLFCSAFAVQLATLREAAARGLSEPRFLTSRGSLGISDRMIY